MTAFDKARDGIKMLETAIHGLEIIQDLTKLGGGKAEYALKTIDSVVQTLIDGFDGNTSPEIVLAAIQSLNSKLDSNDLQIDIELHKKFDTSGS